MVYNDNMEEKYTDVIWDTIAERIGGYLSSSEMSYQDCADRINEYCVENRIDYSSTPQGIHQYLRTGKRETRITPAFISIFAKTFNVSADWIMGLSDTPSIDADDKSVSKALGISDPLTIEALRKAFATEPNRYSYTPLLEKIVQSKDFNRLFDGYKQWVLNHLNYYTLMYQFEGLAHKDNLDQLKDMHYQLEFDQAYACIMRSSWQAVEKINIRDFIDYKKIPPISTEVNDNGI